MPKKVDKISINSHSLDRRVKLNPKQKEKIVEGYKSGISQRKLAAAYCVSRRTIQFIVNPESKEENLTRRRERGGWKQYYNKEKQREYMKDHRDYKDRLFEKKLIGN